MARIRTVKPEFFRHGDLYDLDKRTGLPVRLLYIALWTICDKEGRFRWRVREMRLDLMPYDSEKEMETCLEALAEGGFVTKYEANGETYGFVPTFKKHQRVSGKESQDGSRCPPPQRAPQEWEAPEKHSGSNGEAPGKQLSGEGTPIEPEASPGTHEGSTREATGKQSGSTRQKPRTSHSGERSTGREGNGTRADARVSPSAFPDPGELAVMSVDQIHDLMLAATTEGELYALTGELKRRRGE